MTQYQTIEAEYNRAKATKGDIDEHLPTLLALAKECDHVVEGGVRYVVSTWAFILGCSCRGGKVVSYCWNLIPEIERAIKICSDAGVPWEFHDGDWLQQEIPETDMLFIDTNHYYWQLKKELEKHGPKARKYIVCHDTKSFGRVSQDGTVPGLWAAIEEFIRNGQWIVKEHHENCNGLTVLERIAGEAET
jgi:hypothetical protein